MLVNSIEARSALRPVKPACRLLQDVALETAELRNGLLDVEKERHDLRQQRRLAKIKLTKCETIAVRAGMLAEPAALQTVQCCCIW